MGSPLARVGRVGTLVHFAWLFERFELATRVGEDVCLVSRTVQPWIRTVVSRFLSISALKNENIMFQFHRLERDIS